MAQTTCRLALLFAALLCSAPDARAQFQDNTADIPSGSPFNNSRSENVDFADVDLDGDWDAAFADGGDAGNDQNRLWINQGGAQGGTTGVFVDRTSTQFPAVSDQSRDIEFVDFDGDGDPDLYISNTAQIVNQSNRWWVNNGGLQAGTTGVYTDETASRWVGLGGAGSSIAPFLVLGGGGFIDWSCDSDFGDLDNDGDLDLVHSSYGGAFGGQVPTRIFLNDGAGFFSEFNPSGFQLGGALIADGDPGLWCDGTQLANTINTTGASCDIASSALDIDVGDIDGDLDLDILHGARQELPRMFANRLEASSLAPDNGGALGFRDVTGAVFPPGYSTGSGHYEQEMGDLDGDGDLDILGINWLFSGFSFQDVTLRNNGSGVFDSLTVLPNSNPDDSEGDFFDYDGDGDLDIYLCNFSGQDRLYRNNNNGGASYSFTDVTGSQLPSTVLTGLDADACDVDNDGDQDLFVSNDSGARNYYLENLNNVPDTTPPYIPNVEQAPDRACGATPTVVRAQVYDNAPYYNSWYNQTWVEVSVDGGVAVPYPAVSSAGQLFRAEIPGELSGSITYTFVSEDQYGNQGSSATLAYDGSGSCLPCVGGGDKDDCGAPEVIQGVGDFCYDTVGASDSPEDQNEFPCNFDSGNNNFHRDVWWDWTAPYTHTFEMSTCGGGNGDTSIAVYRGSCSNLLPALACNDDDCGVLSRIEFFALGGRTYKLRLGGGPAGGAPLGPGSGRMKLGIPGAGLFSGYCIAGGNSVDPGGALIFASGSASVAVADLTLFAGPAPNQPGLFYYGPNQIQVPFGDGFRCVGGNVVRLPVEFASGNVLTHVVDVGANGPAFLLLGAVNFQAWYRDPAAAASGFNLSDALQINFVP